MTRLCCLLLLLGVAGCATDEDAAGTSNSEVTTPAEVAPELGTTPDASAPDSTE